MKRTAAMIGRNCREILRDPLSLIFGFLLPLALLVLMSAISRNLPEAIFPIDRFAPGMAVFSQTFLMLFGGLLLAGDRSSAFLARCFASPLSVRGYLMAYTIPLIPIGLAQGAVCFLAALFFDLPISLHLLWAELALIPAILLFVAFGLLFGVLCSDKQVGGMASIIIQVASLLSGIWFDLDLVGGVFGKIARCLPFYHAVRTVECGLAGDFAAALPCAVIVLGYAVGLFALAMVVFSRKRSRGHL